MLPKIFNVEFPSRNDLIEYATKRTLLRHTRNQHHWGCLNELVDSYLSFVQERDLVEYNGKFWICEHLTEFPEDAFKTSLQTFFSNEHLWKHPSAKYMRQEHLRLLFFIAALRYQTLQEPQQQIKFEEANQSEGGIIDLFLFDRDKVNPKYALQIRLLTRFDVDKRGFILNTPRTSEFLEKGINTFEKYKQDSQVTFKSSLYAIGSRSIQEAKTHGCVVLVTPNGMVWLDCGRYSETAISGLLYQDSSLQSQPNNQVFTFLQNQQSQENMLNFGSQNSSFAAPSRVEKNSSLFQQIYADYERKERKREADQSEALSQLSRISHFSAIPSRDSDSWAGSPNYSVQSMPSVSQQSSQDSWHTNWYQHNRLQNYAQHNLLQYPGQGMPLVQLPAFQPNLFQPMIAMPNPNQLAYPNYHFNYQGYQQQQMAPGFGFNNGNGWIGGGY